MPGEWMDVKTGVKTSYYPPTPAGQPSSIIYVETPPSPMVYRPGTSPTHASSGELSPQYQAMFEALGALIKWALILVLAAVALAYLGFMAFRMFDRHWTAKNASGPLVYSQSELNLRSALASWQHHHPIFLPGRSVVVDADIKDKNVFSYQDMTVKGDITNSQVSSTNGSLTVGNVENSTLTAHKIVITGVAKNTKQVILPPDRVASPRRAKRSTSQAHP